MAKSSVKLDWRTVVQVVTTFLFGAVTVTVLTVVVKFVSRYVVWVWNLV
jgi:hypothetical protein